MPRSRAALFALGEGANPQAGRVRGSDKADVPSPAAVEAIRKRLGKALAVSTVDYDLVVRLTTKLAQLDPLPIA